MNFLKKKLKGHKKGYKDDDDDDYIPAVPPHPDDIAKNPALQQQLQQQQQQPITVQPAKRDDILTADLPEVIVNQEDSNDNRNESQATPSDRQEEEVKQQEAVTSEPKENKDKDKEKENKEEWKFFLQLTQRVQETVSKTQTALEKIKETSAADEIAKQSEYDYGLEPEEEELELEAPDSFVVADKPEKWLAFEESDFSAKATEEEPETVEPEPEEKCVNKLPDLPKVSPSENTGVKSLLDDFGFCEEPKTSNAVKESDVIFDYENDYLDDPFDTSFVDISVIPSKAVSDIVLNGSVKTDLLAYSKEPCDNILDPLNPLDPLDPFDTSHIDSVISEVSKPVKPEFLEWRSYSCGQSLGGTPLSVLPDEVINYTSGKLSRYGSRDSIASIMSNPFLTDTDYYTPISSGAVTPSLFADGRRRRSSTNPFEQSPDELADTAEASAIAALTQDFCKAIGEDSYLPSVTSQEPFDPFATIVDDFVESQNTSKRQSVTADGEALTQLGDVFAATTEPSATHLTTDTLLAGTDYLSDLSDTEEPCADTDGAPDSQGRRRSSAFQMELLDGDRKEPPPKFEPLPDLVTRKASLPQSGNESSPDLSSNVSSNIKMTEETNFFDPFETVVEKDLFSPTTPPHEPVHIIKTSERRSEDLFDDIGEPNKEATGIDNDAFEDNISPDRDLKDVKGDVHADNLKPVESEPMDVLADDAVFVAEEAPADLKNGELDSAVTEDVTSNSQYAFDTFAAGDVDTAADNTVLADTETYKDPFDTSDFHVEGSLPYTDTASFDAFAAKFDQASDFSQSGTAFDPFSSPANKGGVKSNVSDMGGFDIFDPFAPATIKPPENTPIKLKKMESKDSFDDDDTPDFKVVIKAKMKDASDIKENQLGIAPLLPPPPKTPVKTSSDKDIFESSTGDQGSKDDFDEFEAIFGGTKSLTETANTESNDWPPPALGDAATKRTDSLESPQTPLFDDDTSQPLEDFPPKYEGEGWEMYLRHPTKKKLTGNRYWKKIFVKLSENSVIQLYTKKEDNDPFQELPLQACYSLSEISAQQYDQYGKIFTVKLQYIFYRERVGVRKGQIAKVMQGQIMSVGQIAKLGMPLEHAPQVSELLKLGTQNYDDLKVFVLQVEDALFHLTIHRDRALTYKTEEIQVTVQDELYVEQTKTGYVTKQLARVRMFFLAFINGMPTVEVGMNDMIRQGKEVVGRHDIIPVVTEEWIRLEACEFHASVMQEEFEKTRIIALHPPDACLFELVRFRVRPPKNRELPLQVSTTLTVTKTKVELRCEVLVPGCISRKHGQIPCEDICIRMHIPECWIYFFRTEKHLRYGSVKSASRRPGKIKGIERFLGATHNIEPTLLEASAGQAKYEHALHALVWRIPRLPKEGQGAYTQQLLVLRLPLTSFDQVPDKFYEYVHVEFTMPATTVSHAVVRSISVTNENPPEKFVRYVAKHVYKVEINVNYSYEENEYIAAAGNVSTTANAVAPQPIEKQEVKEEESEDSD